MDGYLDPTEKSGYLEQDFRLFHIKDQTEREYVWHYHDFHKVLVFLSGKAAYHIEGKSYYLKPWDILLVSRHAIHRPEIDFSVPYERYILWIRDDIPEKELTSCFQKASDRSFNLIRLEGRMQERLRDTLSQLEAALGEDGEKRFGSGILSEALFNQFMVYINRIFLEKQYIVDRKSYASDPRVEELLRYINQNLSGDLSAEMLSQKFFLSKYHLMRKFKEETGYTLHGYIQNKRLLHARSLIASGVPVHKAAAGSGFQDYTTFFRAYKKQFQTVPSDAKGI